MPCGRIASIAVLFALGVGAAARPAAAQVPVASLADGREGDVAFASTTPSGPEQYLRGPAEPAVVRGTLRLPEGDGRMPAVVLTHSAGGISQDRDLVWAERLRAAGMAAFVVDSFGPRGVTGFDHQPSVFASVADVFAALRLLRTHPRVDPDRVAVMGFSRGGGAALAAALGPGGDRGTGGGPGFAAHVALYPGCAAQYRAAGVSGVPILLLLAAADDQAAPGPCRDYAAWFRARGARVEVEEYPGALYLFDGTGPARLIPGAGSLGDCSVVHDLDTGALRPGGAGEPAGPAEMEAYLRACRRRGVHVGGDNAARRSAQERVPAFLREAFGNRAARKGWTPPTRRRGRAGVRHRGGR